jgi:hypothetical protein
MGRINEIKFSNTSKDEAYGGDGIELQDFGVDSFPEKKRKRKQVKDNFLVSDPSRGGKEDKVDTFQDLAFPVVDPNGSLNSSNDTLHKGPLVDADTLDNQTDAFGEEKQDRLEDKIKDLKKKHFGSGI